MARTRERLASLLLLAASLGVVLGSLEILARLTAGRGSATAQGGTPLGRYHPLLGWEKTPGAEAHLKRSEYDVHIAINSHGLRGPDRDYAKPPTAKRVLILGDSFGEGYYVEEDQTARALLEKGLQGSFPGSQILNGSTAGYSTDQEYLYFTSEGCRYRPDVVVLFVFSNDIPDNMVSVGNAERPKPFFLLKDGTLSLRNTPVPRTRGGEEARPAGLTPYHHSVALRWLSNRTESTPRLHEALARLFLVPHLSPDPPRDFVAFRTDGRRDEMWDLFRGLLSGLKDATADCGARLIVLYVPARFEIEDASWNAWLARYPPARRWERDRMARRLQDACARLGIAFVDPREDLRRATEPAYFPVDGHWNILGNRIASEALLGPLKAALQAGPPPPGSSGGG